MGWAAPPSHTEAAREAACCALHCCGAPAEVLRAASCLGSTCRSLNQTAAASEVNWLMQRHSWLT